MTALDSRTAAGPAADDATAPPRTTLPSRAPRSTPARPRQLRMIRLADVVSLLGAFFAAMSTTAILWQEISPFSGLVGAVIVCWFLFVLYYAALISFDEDRMTVRDRVSSVIVHSLALLVGASLLYVIIYTFYRGWPALVHLNFYTQDGRFGGPSTPLTKSGALHAVVGTLIELSIAMAIAVPLGLVAAVFINEVPGRYSRFVRTVVDAMTAMPDILAGLFIFATLILAFGLGLSGLAAGVALGVTALPIVCRASDVVLRLMPGGLTEASYALGATRWRTVRLVTLPTVRSGLATAVILGSARAIGETAPVLITSIETGNLTFNPVSGPLRGAMNSLPLMAYSSVNEPSTIEHARGFAAAALLLILVLILFTVARRVGGRGPGVLTAGGQRRRSAASKRDAERFIAQARERELAAARGPARAGFAALPGAEIQERQ